MSEEELIEKIRALLPSVETAQIDPEASPADTACAKCLEKDLLLQRCLESLRWKYSPEEPTESGDYLVETVDSYGDEGFEILYYKTSKAFGNKWCLGSGYMLVRWLPIPQ